MFHLVKKKKSNSIGGSGSRSRHVLLATTAIMFGLSIQTHAFAQSGDEEEFDIPPSEMTDALQTYSDQADVEIIYAERDVADKVTNGVDGSYSKEAALDEIIEGTDLVYEINDDGVVVIRAAYVETEEASIGKFSSREYRVAQISQNGVATDATVSDGDGEEEKRDVVIVTGTHIRGVENASSPIFVFDREAIDRAGFATTQQLLSTFPQNLDFSANTAGVGAGPAAGLTGGGAAGVNIRGLGADSTLTLVNGRRLAGGGGAGSFVDISLIPLTAIERVEVLTDGASAVYGSDAVGGVVNFILRNDYDGAETRLRLGGATHGSAQEYQASQVLGRTWKSGNILASYEYYRRNNLSSQSRSFTEDALDPSDLLPRVERHSAYLTGRQEFTDIFEIFGDASYSKNDALNNSLFAGSQLASARTETQQFGGSVGAGVGFLGGWHAEVVGAYNRSEIFQEQRGTFDAETDSSFGLWTVDARVDGTLIQSPGGDVKLAIGGQYRGEELNFQDTRLSDLVFDRDVYALFGELFIPIVGVTNGRPGVRALDLTVSGRFEDYSDFGSTTNPKLGIRWAPIEDLNLRGTFGTSFRAPLLRELGGNVEIVPFPSFFFVPNPASPTPPPNVLRLGGANPNLGPEQARTWTVGFDYKPQFATGLVAKFTYFDVDFDERIGAVAGGADLFTIFLNTSELGDALDLSPDLAEVNALYANPSFFNPFGVPANQIGAILDSRRRNLSSADVRGVDFTLGYSAETALGNLAFDLNGSYLIDFINRQTSSATPFDTVDTLFNPVDLRMRGSIGWSREGVNAVASVSYVDDYTSDATGVTTPVASWTTIDVNLSYDTENYFDSQWLNQTRFSLNIVNLFNEDPPFVENGLIAGAFDFDGVNANALGRFISFQITKEW